jgi:hypothetical protein
MIRTYGQGQATSITKRLDHHAERLVPLAGALMNGLLASEVARDGQVHELHLGKGAGGVNLYLVGGAKFAFRAGLDANQQYERVEILDAPQEGDVVATVREPNDVPAAIGMIEASL